MENTKYDVIIIGGGTSGCACAWMCGKLGLKTLVIEKRSYLGGAISGGLVLPMMKSESKNINQDFFKDLIQKMKEYDAQITYSDNNPGWFNPELLKIVLDDMLTSNGIDILFNTFVENIETNIDKTHNDNMLNFIKIKRNILSYYDDKIYSDKIFGLKNENLEKNDKNLSKIISAKFYIDASGDAIISELLNSKMQNDNDKSQAETLRFVMANVDTKAFADWICKIDTDRNVTNVTDVPGDGLYLTTAYTSDKNKKWGLESIFSSAITNGDLEEADAEYFQIFSIAKMPGAIAFNCPRINSNQSYEQKLISARKQILRLSKFCKKYFKGFENAYISNIADEIGVRVSNRPLAKYNFSINDIMNKKQFDNIALHTNYPIDVHSLKDGKDLLNSIDGYDFPVEALMSANYNNLYNIGRAIGADFLSQASLRIQKSCFSMGEAVAKHIKNRLSNNCDVI